MPAIIFLSGEIMPQKTQLVEKRKKEEKKETKKNVCEFC